MNKELFLQKHPRPLKRKKRTYNPITTRRLTEINDLRQMGYDLKLICKEFMVSFFYAKQLLKKFK